MMKLIIVLSILTLSFARHPRVRHVEDDEFRRSVGRKFPGNALISGRNRERGMKALMRAKRFINTNGCDTHVCFLLDSGVFVSHDEYRTQQDFVSLVSAVAGLDERFFVAGKQYGLRNAHITRLTQNVDQFLINLNRSTTPGSWTEHQRRVHRHWRPRSQRSFSHSLSYCMRELKNGAPSADKIFFLGDVHSPRGGVRHARRFLPPLGNGAMCYVGLRNASLVKLERITGEEDDSDLAFDFFDEALHILEDFVKAVCGPS